MGIYLGVELDQCDFVHFGVLSLFSFGIVLSFFVLEGILWVCLLGREYPGVVL
jgi:hypothetical protein